MVSPDKEEQVITPDQLMRSYTATLHKLDSQCALRCQTLHRLPRQLADSDQCLVSFFDCSAVSYSV